MLRSCLAMLCGAALPLTAAEPSAKPAPAKPVVAVYNLDGALSEDGQPETDTFAVPDLHSKLPLTLLDLTLSLGLAADDPEVKAIVIHADNASLNLAQVQEIRTALLDARSAGKDVWVYSQTLNNRSALLGSAANHFALMPEADSDFSGIHSEQFYFKGLLDRVGVQADVIHIGDFKSYGETYYRNGPSEPSLKQEEELVGSIFDGLVHDIAAGRKLPDAKVRELIDRGTLTAREAKDAGLADELLYRTGFNDRLREVYGKDADFDDAYELPDPDGPQIHGLSDLLKLLFSGDKSEGADQDYVAVVSMAGEISDDTIEPVRREILRACKDPKAKALVLRVDSPGGSALSSEVLWEATDTWKKTKRPFLVSMGEVAASGGYYISSGADRIFAEPGTITGSIGVVGMKFVIGGAMEKLGVTSHVIQRGANAGVMSSTRPFSPQEADMVRRSMTDVYGTFKKRVTDGRGAKLKGPIDALAGGRVYSGSRALEIGLVDELGGLGDAISEAADRANLDEPDVRLLPEPKTWIESLFSKPEKPNDDEIIRAPDHRPAAARLRAEILRSGLTAGLPADARRSLNRLLHHLTLDHAPAVQLLAPDITVR